MPRYFVTATGTGQGKTLVTAALCHQWRQQGGKVSALKPVVSGYDPMQAAESDPGLLLQSLGREVTAEAIAAISPWRFAAPLSPDLAAAQEGASLNLDALTRFCHEGTTEEGNNPHSLCLIEGAGGVMTPLNARHTHLDLIAALGDPVILVSASYLGCISPLLTALALLRHERIAVAAVILNANPSHPDFLPLETVEASLLPHLPPEIPYAAIPALQFGARMWENAPRFTILPDPA